MHELTHGGECFFYGRDIVDMHIANGQTYLGPAEIECMSVAEVLRHAENAEIDLLNIDIETMEASVLSAWDWMNRRPKIICVEIHARTMINVLRSDVSWLLMKQGYLLMSRIFQSAVFVDGRSSGLRTRLTFMSSQSLPGFPYGATRRPLM